MNIDTIKAAIANAKNGRNESEQLFKSYMQTGELLLAQCWKLKVNEWEKILQKWECELGKMKV